jgi:hypothetical protein
MSYTNGLDKPSDYFNTKLTTGTGSSQAVTGLGFQPDFLWGKRRDSTGNNTIFDVVRGITKGLETNSTGAEFTSTDYYDSFDSDGFTIASGSSGCGNGSGQTAVQWNWLADNTSGSSNTDGSITSTVSANTTSGFSIVSYTGTGAIATVGHGLGVAPAMIITKDRDSGGSGYWGVYHQSLGNTKALFLNLTNASGTNVAYWNNTSPTTSVFSLGDGSTSNVSSENHIAYCFAGKQGYSKFGSYTGNGNADGTFVYTGFKPAFVIVKRTDTTNNWLMYDNKRDPDNLVGGLLFPNLSNAEDIQTTANVYDFTSNGFKARSTYVATNASGGTYIYMCFAEHPFVTSTGIPTTAR